MNYYRWRVKEFHGRTWENYRYYKTDYPAFLHLLTYRRKEHAQLDIQLKPGGAFMNPGGTDNLLWIQHSPKRFGKPREYWENLLKRAKSEIMTNTDKEKIE